MFLGFATGILSRDLSGIGVDFLDPLNPIAPDEDQEIALPCASVMVIIVLLKLAFTCATPDAMFFFSRRLTRAFSFAIV